MEKYKIEISYEFVCFKSIKIPDIVEKFVVVALESLDFRISSKYRLEKNLDNLVKIGNSRESRIQDLINLVPDEDRPKKTRNNPEHDICINSRK